MILNEDSTFRYLGRGGDLFQIIANGQWGISPDKKFLIFTSELLSDSDLIDVTEGKSHNIPDSSFKIDIADLNGDLTTAYVKLNPDTSHTDFVASDYVFGSKVYKGKSVHSFALTCMALGSKVLFYELKDKKVNELRIRFKLLDPRDYRYFKDEKWRIKLNRLFDPAFTATGNIYYKTK